MPHAVHSCIPHPAHSCMSMLPTIACFLHVACFSLQEESNTTQVSSWRSRRRNRGSDAQESEDRNHLNNGEAEEEVDVNTLRARQNGHHFPNNIFKCIFFYENVWISIKISLKFVPKVPIDNKPTLVQIMAWHWPAIIWTNDGLVYWCIHASLGVNELTHLWPRQNGQHFADNIFKCISSEKCNEISPMLCLGSICQ